MNELFPIIRRVRRPLIATESVTDGPPAPVVVGNVEPVQPVAAKPVEPVVSEGEPRADDAQATPNRSER